METIGRVWDLPTPGPKPMSSLFGNSSAGSRIPWHRGPKPETPKPRNPRKQEAPTILFALHRDADGKQCLRSTSGLRVLGVIGLLVEGLGVFGGFELSVL